MATTAAQMAAYLYDKDQDPAGAFEWWLSPCGGTDLVPDEIKKAFGILSQVANGVSSFVKPKTLKPGSGRKGDEGNPRAPTKPRPANGVSKPKKPAKCRVPPALSTLRLGVAKNTLRIQSCDKDKTIVTEMVVTTLTYAPNARATQVTGTCGDAFTQACYHYSSAIRVNPQWATLTCPPEAATTSHRDGGRATDVWKVQHDGSGWTTANPENCQRDEYPPAYLLNAADPARVYGGIDTRGQLVRWMPSADNTGAGSMWRAQCLRPALMGLTDQELLRRVIAAPPASKSMAPNQPKASKVIKTTFAAITVDHRPEFTVAFNHAGNLPNDGLNDNPCWPSNQAGRDPGFVLLTYDKYYTAAPPYNYRAPYIPGVNGD